ncbi:transposase [Mitsuokella sp. AF21-1AC]|uniref:IS66 family transposase n=1 Tax=Mitsuokella sp. AF21-1AC TaxID=2292235 RepID=UPI001313EF7A
METANEQMDFFNEAESRRRKMRPNRALRCPHVYRRCGTALTSMAKEKLRTEIEFIPAKIKVIDYCRKSFQCLACRKEEHFSIEKPAMPLVSRLQQDLLEQDVIHADETPVQVHKEKGRKNWLFSDSLKGAKANGLNPFQYLFEHLPNADIQQHPEYLDDVLPWNETIQ